MNGPKSMPAEFRFAMLFGTYYIGVLLFCVQFKKKIHYIIKTAKILP